jgi:hypothetical protein
MIVENAVNFSTKSDDYFTLQSEVTQCQSAADQLGLPWSSWNERSLICAVTRANVRIGAVAEKIR